MIYKIGYHTITPNTAGVIDAVVKQASIESNSLENAIYMLSSKLGIAYKYIYIKYIYIDNTNLAVHENYEYASLSSIGIYKALGNYVFGLDKGTTIWIPMFKKPNANTSLALWNHKFDWEHFYDQDEVDYDPLKKLEVKHKKTFKEKKLKYKYIATLEN